MVSKYIVNELDKTETPDTRERVYGYIRVSSEGQASGDGPERQLDAIKKHCERYNYTLVRVFEDHYTGVTDERPEWINLTLAMEDNEDRANKVIIEKLDRLARHVIVSETMINFLLSHGHKLESYNEGIDLATDDPSRVFSRQIFAAAAQYEKALIVIRLKVAREREKARLIKKTGNPNVKYEGRKNYAEKYPELIEAVKLVVAENPKASHSAIADELNRRGIQPVKMCNPRRSKMPVGHWEPTEFNRNMVKNIMKYV